MDVKYIPSDWEKMRNGIKELIGYGVYGKGMFEDLKKLNEVLEEAEGDIAKYDTDGVISFSHTSQKSTYQTMFEKFEVLYRYTDKVDDIVDRTIDQPFYEDMDAFVSAMEEATISKYKTKNRIGATELQTFGYGTATVMEVPKTEVSLDDLLSGGNFYSEQIKLEYEEWKKVNPNQDLSQSDYQQAALNMRAFEYESIRDHQENKEFWVQIGALVVIVGISFVCLPAGLALGAVYGTLELGSAVSGEDWVSGRDLGTGERWFRGLLAPLDIIPATAAFTKFTGNARNIGRMTDNLGAIAVKSGVKEGIQQGVSQVDNLVEEAAKEIPSRLKSADAAIDDQFSEHALKAAVGDEFNLANTTVPLKPLNISSTRKIDNLVEDVGEVNKAVPDNSVNKDMSSVSQYNKEKLSTMEGFMDNIESKTKAYDLTKSQFDSLRLKPTNSLLENEKEILRSIRNGITSPDNTTIMQKVIPKGDISKYIDGIYTTIGGYITRAQDVKQLDNYMDIFDSLRLDYPGTVFKTNEDEFLGVIRFQTPEASKIEIPYGKDFGGNITDADPFTGNGFTKATNGQSIPEYKCNAFLDILNGAELYKVTKDGEEILFAIYDKRLGNFELV
jgi:hypothetical protein